MGNGNSNAGRSNNSGLNQHCYNVGYDHATTRDIDPVGQGIDAFPCTTNENANKAYAKGYTDGIATRSTDRNTNSNQDRSKYVYGHGGKVLSTDGRTYVAGAEPRRSNPRR